MPIVQIAFRKISSTSPQYFDLPDYCPRCSSGITPTVMHVSTNNELFRDGDEHNGSATLCCPTCKQPFVCQIEKLDARSTMWKYFNLQPQIPAVRTFDKNLIHVSQRFIDIYHQAQKSEALGLNEITGMGYRKALEFLIKDYAILLTPDDEDAIKSKRLQACIDKYISHPKIQATAKAATWIGNDESHYIRIWETKDIADLKRFIDSCVYWILADYDATEALSMTSEENKTPTP